MKKRQIRAEARRRVKNRERLREKREERKRERESAAFLLDKLNIQPGDILLYRVSSTTPRTLELLDTAVSFLKGSGASGIILLNEGDSVESMAPQLFEEAISKVVGEKAKKAIMDYVTNNPAPIKSLSPTLADVNVTRDRILRQLREDMAQLDAQGHP